MGRSESMKPHTECVDHSIQGTSKRDAGRGFEYRPFWALRHVGSRDMVFPRVGTLG